MAEVLLVFTRPLRPSWFQRLIQWRQVGSWTHVVMAIPAGDMGYEILEARAGGLRQWFSHQIPGAVAESVPVHLSDVQMARVRGWWAVHIGASYDAVGLIEVFLGKASTDKTAWFCSEACTAALQAAGVFAFAEAGRITPEMLMLMAKARQEAIQCAQS